MIKCGQVVNEGVETHYGKDICCWVCDEKDSCKHVCDSYLDQEECEDKVEDLPATFESKGGALIKSIADITTQMNQLKEQEKAMREKLLQAMEEFGVKKFENDLVSFTYKEATTQTRVDIDKLKADGLFDKYSKTSNVAASVVIKVKN